MTEHNVVRKETAGFSKADDVHTKVHKTQSVQAENKPNWNVKPNKANTGVSNRHSS